ncbi:MAG: hypothetical protein Q9226_005405 [Calogaya cf. arnoldii]
MQTIFTLVFATLAWSSSPPPPALGAPGLNIANQNALSLSCDPIPRPAANWYSCYNAWEKMQDDFPQGSTRNLHFLGRHVRSLGPPGTITKDLKMDAERFPSGQRDLGDDAYADSVLEAARHVLDTCVRETKRGGWVKRFSTTHRLGIIFSSYANRLRNIQCGMIPPSPPFNQAFKDKVASALHSLPTNEKVSTTFNRTREPGPAGSRVVTYLLPRREPAANPPPVLRVDMVGNEVTAASMWDVWTAGIAVNTVCVQKNKQGYASGIGEWPA